MCQKYQVPNQVLSPTLMLLLLIFYISDIISLLIVKFMNIGASY